MDLLEAQAQDTPALITAGGYQTLKRTEGIKGLGIRGRSEYPCLVHENNWNLSSLWVIFGRISDPFKLADFLTLHIGGFLTAFY